MTNRFCQKAGSRKPPQSRFLQEVKTTRVMDIFVVPEMNMVVVFTGSSWKMNDPTYFEIMDNYLIE